MLPSLSLSYFLIRVSHVGNSLVNPWPGSPMPPLAAKSIPAPTTGTVIGCCGNPETHHRAAPLSGSYDISRPDPTTTSSSSPSCFHMTGVDHAALKRGRGVVQAT